MVAERAAIASKFNVPVSQQFGMLFVAGATLNG